MKKLTRSITILLFAILAAISCSKDNPQPITNAKLGNLFDSFWVGMNKNYVFWDIDTIDWERTYIQYKPVFNSLNINSESDNRKAFDYLRTLTSKFVDGHFSIRFYNQFLQNSVIYPSYYSKVTTGVDPFNYIKIDTALLDAGYSVGYDSVNIINGNIMTAVCGTIRSNILFFSCNAFNLYKLYTSPQPNSVAHVVQRLLDGIKNETYKGLIIDVRNNPGGNLQDLNFLVGQLVNQKHAFGFTRYKTGNGRLDFSPWIQSFINPVQGSVNFNKPKIVLTDQYSASLSELITMAIRSLPNSYVIGERTWGATGILTDNQLYNSGQFEVENYMKVITTSVVFKYLDNKIYESIGFAPDIRVPFNRFLLEAGKDLTLEQAVNLIK